MGCGYHEPYIHVARIIPRCIYIKSKTGGREKREPKILSFLPFLMFRSESLTQCDREAAGATHLERKADIPLDVSCRLIRVDVAEASLIWSHTIRQDLTGSRIVWKFVRRHRIGGVGRGQLC